MPRYWYFAPRVVALATASLLIGGCSSFPQLTRTEVASVPEPKPEPVVIVPAWMAPPSAPMPASDEAGISRLQRLADVWNAVRWFHPNVLENVGAWDTAYLKHVDRVRSASDDAAFAQAVQAMLSELRDVSTRVVGDTAIDVTRRSPVAVRVITSDSLTVVRPVMATQGSALNVLRTTMGDAMVTRAPRTTAVLDLRSVSGSEAGVSWAPRGTSEYELPLPGGTLSAPARRRLRRSEPNAPLFASGSVAIATGSDCCTEWQLTSGARYRAAQVITRAEAQSPLADTALARAVNVAADGYAPPGLVVIVDDNTTVPSALFTLHAGGDAVFVSSGTGVLQSDAKTVLLPLSGGFHARVRIEELLLSDGTAVPTRADTVLASAGGPAALLPDTSDAALQLALSIARGTTRVRSNASVARLTTLEPRAALASPVNAYPSHPERLLAATQLWGAVRAFNPYLPMANESWDEVFVRTLASMETAASARAYASALYRFTAALDASQVRIAGPEHPEFGPQAGYVPMRLQLVDRRVLITQIDDTSAARSGMSVGDEVVAVGGEPIDKRFGRLQEFVSASNEWSRNELLALWLEQGPARQRATYRVRSAGGTISEAEFAYREASRMSRVPPFLPRRVDSLGSGVLRIVLGSALRSVRGAPATVEPLPADLAQARGIIVDARGTTDNTSLAWLAGSLLDGDSVVFARTEQSVLTAPVTAGLRTPEVDPAREYSRRELATPQSDGAKFSGPIVVLVDAKTSGDGELLAMRIVAGGPQRVLIGTTTAGTVGPVAAVLLPGDFRVAFPVGEVRRADGRSVQRLGLEPSLLAQPTLEGVRAGRDEGLEAAQRWIAQQLAPPAPLRRR